jgi:hypothetical protein
MGVRDLEVEAEVAVVPALPCSIWKQKQRSPLTWKGSARNCYCLGFTIHNGGAWIFDSRFGRPKYKRKQRKRKKWVRNAGVEWRWGRGKVKKGGDAGNKWKIIKYWIAYEICEPKEWNSDKSQNKEIIKSLLIEVGFFWVLIFTKFCWKIRNWELTRYISKHQISNSLKILLK